MTHINTLIDRLIRIKDGLTLRADRDAINDACDALAAAQNDAHPLGLKLATILGAALPLLDNEARREIAREAGKPMRQITAQRRAEAARVAVSDAEQVFGFRP